MDPSKFVAPTEIPSEIPPPIDDLPEFSSVVGPGGVPGGGVGGVPGGTGNIGMSAAPPPPPPRKKKAAVRVGGNVQSSKLIRRVEPKYPELAKRARVQGIVLLQVTVDETGSVAGIKVIRGHPLLTPPGIGCSEAMEVFPHAAQR